MIRVLVLALLLSGSLACASLGSGDSQRTSADETRGAMDQRRMERIFADQVDAIAGPEGAIHTVVDGVRIYLVSDPANDRMRILAPIAETQALDSRVLPVLLEANFHRALDARYATSEGVVYALYLHPLSTLTEEEIVSGFEQVLSLAKTFGTTFSSGKLQFGAPAR